MTIEVHDGPIITTGVQAPVGSTTGGNALGPPPYVSGSNENPDAGPNVMFAGMMIRDPRFREQADGVGLSATGYAKQAAGFFAAPSAGVVAVDAVPSTIATANIAAAQAAATGVALTLVAATGAGITVTTTAFTVLATGGIFPAGARVIDGLPGYVGAGQSGAIQCWDPTKSIARAVSITANAGATGGIIVLRGLDLYGLPQTENITAVANSTVNGKKGFKAILSATPQFTDAGHTYAVGTTDIYEFPIRVDTFAYADIFWNSAGISANTGFVAADATAPTATTGSVRGTYAVQSASDGTKSLQFLLSMSVANAISSSYANAVLGMFGQVPA